MTDPVRSQDHRGRAESLDPAWTAWVSDPVAVAAFGLDTVGPADEARLLTKRQRSGLPAQGVWWPTRDPRHPETILGLVRLTPAKRRHRCLTPPMGLGCTADLSQSRTVILCDAPLTVLRLHAEGVAGIAYCPDPAVLPPLREWLADRDLILLGHRQRDLDALAAALTGLSLRRVLLPPVAESRLVAEALRLLEAATPIPPPAATPTPHLRAHILAYAQDRLRSGVGIEALQERGWDQPDLLAVYGAGVLPAGWEAILSEVDSRNGPHLPEGPCLVLPATDPEGAVVDLSAIPLGATPAPTPPGEVLGLLGARLIRMCRDLILVDRFADLVAHWTAGRRNVLLIRGLADLQANVGRLRASGVQSLHIEVHADAEACRAAWRTGGGTDAAAQEADETPIVVTEDDPVSLPPASGSALAVVSVDEPRHLATFRTGELTYVVEIPQHADQVVEVLARRDGRVHRDRFVLSQAPQRQRFAAAAARRLQTNAAAIPDHLAQIHAWILAHLDRVDAPPAPAPVDAPTAEILADPALVDRLLADLEAVGWVGDDAAKRLGLLCLAGRLLPDPPWLVLQGTPAMTALPLGLLADAAPVEARLHCSRITEASLYHQDRDALRHRVLILDDAATLRAEALLALRILQTRGALAVTQAERDPATGRLRSRASDARGPVALLAASASGGPLDDLALVVPLDDSPALTARILQAQARQRQGRTDHRSRIQDRLRGCFAGLEALPVRIPFAERIHFPATRVEHRRDHARFLALIEASALLHQRQRARLDGALVATEADFQQALAAAGEVLAREGDDLSPRARSLLAVLSRRPGHDWTMGDFQEALPQMSRGTLRRALEDLVCADLVLVSSGGRGRRARLWRVAEDTHLRERETGIQLLPEVPMTHSQNWPRAQGLANNVANISSDQHSLYEELATESRPAGAQGPWWSGTGRHADVG